MKRAIACAMCAAAAGVLPGRPAAGAFRNEPDGFRGIKWGADITKLPEMVPDIRAFGKSIYNRRNENLTMDGALVSGINYYFHDGKLCAVVVFFAGRDDFDRIRKAMFRRYGKEPDISHGAQQYRWEGDNVDIGLSYKGVADVGRVIYVYKPLDGERVKDTGDDLFNAYAVTDETFNFHGR